MADRVAIFIDSAYLEKVLKKDFGEPRINFEKMANRMAGENTILRTHYYHCPPYQGNPPTEEEKRRYDGRRRFYTALDRLPRFTVRLGRLEYRGLDEHGNPRFEQKRVDILLGVDLVQLATKGQIQQAIILAGDSDFIPAITAEKSEGVLVQLFHGSSVHSDLWQEVDERVRIDGEFIRSITELKGEGS